MASPRLSDSMLEAAFLLAQTDEEIEGLTGEATVVCCILNLL
jgi:hypothetical protein